MVKHKIWSREPRTRLELLVLMFRAYYKSQMLSSPLVFVGATQGVKTKEFSVY